MAKGMVAGLLVNPSVAAVFAIWVVALKSLIRLRYRTCFSPIRSRDRIVVPGQQRSKLRDVDPRVERCLS
jgi:hypothetical protein